MFGPAQVRDVFQNERGVKIHLDRRRDELLTAFGKATLQDRYLMNGESFQDLFARVAAHFADDTAHGQRIYDYISRLWFMPATPVLSNGGTTRGLPISCFLNEANDSLEGIVGLWNENVWLAARGGGIGSYWGNLRSIGERVGHNGKTSGVIPFVRVMDSLTLAISQGSLAARLGGLLHADLPSGNRRVRGNAPPHRRRPQPQGPKPASRCRWFPMPSCARSKKDGEWALLSPKRQRADPQNQSAGSVDSHPHLAHRDRRALYRL